MNTALNHRKLIVAGALAAALIGGGVSIAAASDTSSAPSSTSADGQQADGEAADGQDGGPGSEEEAQDPSYTGSVAAPAESEQADGQETAGSEADEQTALEALATVTPSQAERAALTAVPGTVAETDLGNENGWVVYSVEVNGTDGTVTEVTVDAGNGAVLAQQGQDASDPADSADQPEGPGDEQD
jgi:uncharacterized membrane protein YkoI